MSASKVWAHNARMQTTMTSKYETTIKNLVQCINSIFYLCCSGVRHDVTYGHSHTMCESNCRFIISVFIWSMNVLSCLREANRWLSAIGDGGWASNNTCCYVDNYHCTGMNCVQTCRLERNRLTVTGFYPVFYVTRGNDVLGRFGPSNLHRFGCKFVQWHNITGTAQLLHY